MKFLKLLGVLILLGGFTPVYGLVDDWEYLITFDIEQFHSETTVGFNQGASTSFDPEYDQVTPPLPPRGLYVYLEHPDEISFLQKLSTSIVGHQENYEWTLIIMTVGIDGPVVIGWDQTPEDIDITVLDGSDTIPTQAGETIIQSSQGAEYRFTIGAQKKGTNQSVESESTVEDENIPVEEPEIQPGQEEIVESETPVEEESITDTIEIDPIPNIDPTTNVTESVEPPVIPLEEPIAATVQKPVEITDIEFTPLPLEPNQEIILMVTVYNPDEQVQDFILEISVDSRYAHTRTGSIAPGQEKEVSYMFEVTEEGEHTVKVNEEYVKILVGSPKEGIGIPVWPVLLGVIMFVYVTRRFA